MPSLSLQQLNELLASEATTELTGAAVEFLEAFKADEPLQEHQLREWLRKGGRLPYLQDAIGAVQKAIRQGWIEDASDGLRLTRKGEAKLAAVRTASSNDSIEAGR